MPGPQKIFQQSTLPFGQTKPTPPPTIGLPHDTDIGDTVLEKPNDVARITFGNIAGFDCQAFGNQKAADLKAFLRQYEVDYFGGVEPNINWPKLPRGGRLQDWFRTENTL